MMELSFALLSIVLCLAGVPMAVVCKWVWEDRKLLWSAYKKRHGGDK